MITVKDFLEICKEQGGVLVMGEKWKKTKKIRKAIKKFGTPQTRRVKAYLRKEPYPPCKRWRQIVKVGGMMNWETGELLCG